jgi:6-pyruvoyltetrahydropterin/6-carboxytetrahydropterin synthase
MIIRKLFKFEGSHIVRNCSSSRCKFSRHGHSYKVEVFFTADGLDNGGMIMDFGLMKNTIKDLIDSFDHAESLWSKDQIAVEQAEYFSERYIIMPVTPSAEQYSLLFLFLIDKIIKATVFNNGEKNVRVHSVKVHETDTGYAQSFADDLYMINYKLEDIIFSDAVKQEWKSPTIFDDLIASDKTQIPCFENPTVDQQIELSANERGLDVID